MANEQQGVVLSRPICMIYIVDRFEQDKHCIGLHHSMETKNNFMSFAHSKAFAMLDFFRKQTP